MEFIAPYTYNYRGPILFAHLAGGKNYPNFQLHRPSGRPEKSVPEFVAAMCVGDDVHGNLVDFRQRVFPVFFSSFGRKWVKWFGGWRNFPIFPKQMHEGSSVFEHCGWRMYMKMLWIGCIWAMLKNYRVLLDYVSLHSNRVLKDFAWKAIGEALRNDSAETCIACMGTLVWVHVSGWAGGIRYKGTVQNSIKFLTPHPCCWFGAPPRRCV